MAKIAFKSVNFRGESLSLINACELVIDAYQAQDLRLTLRQLYYQLVTKNIIPNTDRSYKNLGNLVADARMAGLLDWDAIEDRVRRPRRASEFSGLTELTEAALRSYRLPRWKGQECYAELWVEKDALAGVLEPLAWEHHVTLMVNRGYSSASAMYEAAQRFIERCRATEEEDDADAVGAAFEDGNGEEGTEGEEIDLIRRPVLFYLGDHDPSGEDMVRDVHDRLRLFGIEVDVTKVALTTAQVQTYRPPPNPAKVTDSRAAAYIAKHGNSSWEVDALPPNVLAQIVRAHFKSILDAKKMDAVKAKEEQDKERLRAAVAKLEN